MKVVKIVSKVLAIISIIFLININSVKAASENAVSIWQTAKDWLNLGESERANSVMNESSFGGIEDLSGLLFGAGIFVSAIVGTIIGIKFMLVSPDEKANLKKDLIPYIAGTVIILGALGIWKLAVTIFEDMAH